MRILILFIFLCGTTFLVAQGSISATYSLGDIPTSYSFEAIADFDDYDSSCTGSSTTLSITLPAGEAYQVTGIDIAYTMTPMGSGLEFDQQSYIYCQNSFTHESEIYSSILADGIPVNYTRNNVDIANGLYPGESVLTFEMRAWRTFGDDPGGNNCNTDYQQIDNNTWTITLHYNAETDAPPRVGIGTDDPDFSAMLDIQSSNSGLLIPRMNSTDREAIVNPANGLLVFDTDESSFWYSDLGTWQPIYQDELPSGGIFNQKLTTDGSGNYYWSTDGDDNPTNEIELPLGGSNGQILSTNGSGTFSWVNDNVIDADNDPTNEIELPLGGSAGQLLSTNGSGTLSWIDPSTASTSDEIVDTDGDTEVYVQDGSSNDFIRFTLEGVERFVINKNTLEPSYSGLYIGQDAGSSTTANNNTYIGNHSGESNVSGSWNTALGHSSLRNATSSENVGVGANALLDLTSGRHNTALGTAAGQSITTGEKNVFLGYDAGRFATGSNQLFIDNSSSANPLIKGDFSQNTLGVNGDLAINANTPDPSASLDISSSTKGLLIPRMTSVQRNNISSPANGLMVYETDVQQGFWYYDGTEWNPIGSGSADIINDLDDDTKIQVEESADEDIIRFDVEGTEYWRMTGPSLVPRNSGNSVYIGNASTGGVANVAIGVNALPSLGSGDRNVAVGFSAMRYNASGEWNTAIGASAGENSIGSNNVYIGHNAGMNGTGNDRLYIDNSDTSFPLIYGDFADNELEINGDLDVSIPSGGASTITMKPEEFSGNGAEISLFNFAGVRTMELDADYGPLGKSRLNLDIIHIRGGSDVAEYFDAKDEEKLVPGTIVAADAENPGGIKLSSQKYDKKIIGVISGANGIETGLVLGQENSIANGDFPVAIVGRVYLKVCDEGGDIEVGDFITTSSQDGIGMKVDDWKKAQGAIIGKALTTTDSEGYILVLVNLQ